jgi:hypothetical protein
LAPALSVGLIEMTIPEEPNTSQKKYQLTDKVKRVLKEF